MRKRLVVEITCFYSTAYGCIMCTRYMTNSVAIMRLKFMLMRESVIVTLSMVTKTV